MPSMALVSCAARKRAKPALAADLYDSQLFGLARQYGETRCGRWFILSAKHHLLSPDTRIEPYDLTLNKMPIDQRKEWAAHVYRQLKNVLKPDETVVMLAGGKYREFLVPKLEQDGIAIEIPMEHLAIGKQLHWLKEHGK